MAAAGFYILQAGPPAGGSLSTPRGRRVRQRLVIKLDIVKAVAAAAEIPQTQAELAVEEMLASIKASLIDSQRIEIRGFGVFSTRPLKRGIARNPRTGQITPIPRGRRTVRFKPGKDLQALPLDGKVLSS
jgi:nucleoid DNA-binding protein